MTTALSPRLLLPLLLSLFTGCAGPQSDSDENLVDAGHRDAGPHDAGVVVDAGEEPPPTDKYGLLAGNSATGFVDGVGTEARFSGPAGAVLSPDGSALYVADTFNQLLRKVDTSTGEVITLVGQVQQSASVDGIGTQARLKSPRALTIAPDGSALYLADGPSIRRVGLPSLEVTTLAGNADLQGHVDAVGDEARLGYLVHSLAISADGKTLYLADRSNRVLRTLEVETREVRTVAGTPYTGGTYENRDGIGREARFSGLGGIVRVGSALFVADTFNHTLRRVDLKTWEVQTVAGAPGQSGIDDGPAADARFNTPQSLTTDGAHLYVTGWDGLLRRTSLQDFSTTTLLGVYDDVRAVDGTGEEVRLGIAFGPPLLDATRGVLYYNDRDASSLRRLDLNTLTMSTLAGASQPRGSRDGEGHEALFNAPSALVYGPNEGAFYVADSENHTLRRVDARTGQVTTIAGVPGIRGSLPSPSGLALDEPRQTLYVSDRASHTVQKLHLPTGALTPLAGATEQAGSEDGAGAAARFSRPRHLALSATGDVLYVADSGNATIRAVDVSTGEVTTIAGSPGEAAHVDGVRALARFRAPAGLAFHAAADALYVSDSAGHTLRRIALKTGEVSTVAGNNGESGVADGVGAAAFFRVPVGLAFGGDGALYVADSSNHLVRRLELGTGAVSTVLGHATRSGGLPPGRFVPTYAATLYFPDAVAVAGSDLAVLTEDAVGLARGSITP